MPKDFVRFGAVKAKVSIRDVLERYGLLAKLTAKGDRLVGLCPIHHKGADTAESNSQQFSVSVSKNAWKCFAGSCGKSGNQIDLVAALEGIEFRAAAVKMAEWFNVDSGEPEDKPVKKEEKKGNTPAPAEPVAEPVPVENKPLSFELKLEASPYFAERGLTDETVAHFGLGISGRGSMKGRACIPIQDHEGHLVAYAGRWIGTDATIPEGEGKYKLPGGFHKGLVVFNAHRVPADAKRVILVEGFWSVFWLHQNGYPNAISVMGSMVTPQQVELLAERFKGVQLFFDGDAAGREGSRKVALELAPRLWVRIIDSPDGLQPDRIPAHELKKLLS